jgi:hypothetical protein
MTNLMKSPLFSSVRHYLQQYADQNNRIFIFVPYIQTSLLRKLTQDLKSKIIVVTSWRLEDLLSGSSELSLYPFCCEHRMTLYINNRLHLKMFSSEFDHLILSTANISEKGLSAISRSNWECATFVEKIDSQDRLYFERILKDSLYVNDFIHTKLKNWYEKQEKKVSMLEQFEEVVSEASDRYFLISSLPMTKDIGTLVEAYEKINRGLTASEDKEVSDCVYHDLANYQIEVGLGSKEFKIELSRSFFLHPFIQRIEELISPMAHFGQVKEWVQKNCVDVPVPSRRALTGNVQVLLEWFVALGEGKYVVDVPGSYSQRIRRI